MRNAGGKTFTTFWAPFYDAKRRSTPLAVLCEWWDRHSAPATETTPTSTVNSPTVGFLTCQLFNVEVVRSTWSQWERWGVAQMMMCWIRLILVKLFGLIYLEVPKKGWYIYFLMIYIYILYRCICIITYKHTWKAVVWNPRGCFLSPRPPSMWNPLGGCLGSLCISIYVFRIHIIQQ